MAYITKVLLELHHSWQSFDWVIAGGVFVAYMFLDMIYARYTFAVVKMKAVAAASWGGIMYIFMAFGIFNYTQNFLYVIPVGLGSWLGTYIVVVREKSKKDSTQSAD